MDLLVSKSDKRVETYICKTVTNRDCEIAVKKANTNDTL